MPTDRPRVVVENRDRAAAQAQVAALAEAGLDVSSCWGPESKPGGLCPLAYGTRCSLVDGADVVVHDLDPDRGEDRLVLRELRRAHPEIPVVVEASEDVARRHGAALAGCTVVRPYGMDHLVEAVVAAASEARTAAER